MRAPTKAEVAELRDRLAAAGIVGGGGSGAGPFQKCRAMITAMMREAYSMPDAYNIRGQKMEVILHARLAQNGSLVKSEIAQPSGNDVFDNYALKALRDAAPFPEDCKEVAGETITFRFRP
jgi:TonB family protein